MNSRGFIGALAIFATAFAVAMLILVAGAHSVNKYGGDGGGSMLPACTSSYWGITINLYGYRWYCAVGSDHWVILNG